MFIGIAMDNLRAKNRARFRPHPERDGYLFEPGDLDVGMQCTDAQRDAYVEDFDRFLSSGSRFMIVWAIATMLLGVVALGWLVFNTDAATYDRLSAPVPAIGAISFVLPLMGLFPQGWTRWRRPSVELLPSAETIVRRRSRREITDLRLRGMSRTLLVVMAGVAGVGLGMPLPDAWRQARVNATILLLFGVLVLAFVPGSWKHGAHRRAGVE